MYLYMCFVGPTLHFYTMYLYTMTEQNNQHIEEPDSKTSLPKHGYITIIIYINFLLVN